MPSQQGEVMLKQATKGGRGEDRNTDLVLLGDKRVKNVHNISYFKETRFRVAHIIPKHQQVIPAH